MRALLILLVLAFTSCIPPAKIQYLQSDCQIDKELFYKTIVPVLLENKMSIKFIDKELGLLTAETSPVTSIWVRGLFTYRWSFQVLDTAKTYILKTI